MTHPFELRVDLPTARGVAQIQLAVDPRPMQLRDLVPFAQQITNIWEDASRHVEETQGRSIACHAGCAACCHHLVMLSVPEALHLAETVAALDDEAQRQTVARFEEAGAALAERDLIESLMAPEVGQGGRIAELVRDYFQLGLPCPLLIDARCRVHPQRPLPCRHYTVTSPATLCDDPYVNPIRRLPMPLALTAPLAHLCAKLTGEPPRLIPLPLALGWAGEHAELADRTWPAPELVQRFFEQVGKAAPPE